MLFRVIVARGRRVCGMLIPWIRHPLTRRVWRMAKTEGLTQEKQANVKVRRVSGGRRGNTLEKENEVS